jgi:type II secretory ATPase GspE/PulE/Tfp pilus assembly ATPase PilB-like protein
MVTTPVRRVLSEFGAADIYVETENSVYRLRFRSAPAVEAAARSTVKSG